MLPLVTTIIPCHNAAAWVSEAIDSALGQDWPRTEVVIIDDGSTDGSGDVIAAYANRGAKIVTQKNRGAAAARNAGLDLAGGEYVQFLDADDVLGREKVSRQMERLLAGRDGNVASCEWGKFCTSPHEAIFEKQPVWRDLSGVDFWVEHYEHGWMMQPACWLVPRQVLDAAGPWDESLSLNDDGEYFCRVLLASSGVLFCPGARVHYRAHAGGNLSARRSPQALHSLRRAQEKNASRLLEADKSPRVRQAVANGWKRLAFELYPVLPAAAREAENREQSLGGSPFPFPAGDQFERLSRLLGWRTAKRLRECLAKYRKSGRKSSSTIE